MPIAELDKLSCATVGEKFGADGDQTTVTAMQAIKDATAEEQRQRVADKASKKAAFNAEYDVGKECGAALRCAGLCCAALCCAALGCAVLRCAVLRCAVLRCAVLCCAVLGCAVLCCAGRLLSRLLSCMLFCLMVCPWHVKAVAKV